MLPALACLALAACPDDGPPAGYPVPTQGYPTTYPTQPYPYPTQTYPTAYPQPTMTAPPPAPSLGPLTTPEGTAGSIDPLVMIAALPTLQGLAARDMVNMKGDENPFAGQFREGDRLVHVFRLQPGRCYGAVAVGSGITELDMEMVLGEPPVDYTMGSDVMKGPQSVIGPQGKCIENTLPTDSDAQIIVIARTGAGTAVAQIYSRQSK